MSTFFCCPLCKKPLLPMDHRAVCPCGHSFDRAKDGHWNLLPVQKKHTKAPGDSAEMIRARRNFLQQGYYAPFAQRLAALAAELAPAGRTCTVLDAGCGEGYYDRAVLPALQNKCSEAVLLGFDISREAVKRAASAQKDASFAVAGCFDIPLQSESADIVMDVFAPFAEKEFARVLKPGGHLIYAVPGPDHLFGMKKVLYEKPYRNPVQQTEYKGFVYEGDSAVSANIRVKKEDIPALFAMTPYYWKTPRDGAERLAALDELETPIEFRFLIYRRAYNGKEQL